MGILSAIKDKIQGKVPLLGRRSPKWEHYRKTWLDSNNECAACGAKDKLQVHHKKCFHLSPELELDYNNYITLCEDGNKCEHHIKIGHLGNFKLENPNVEKDAADIRKNLGLPDLVTVIPKV